MLPFRRPLAKKAMPVFEMKAGFFVAIPTVAGLDGDLL
jgi:hypothetical protein